MYKTSYNIVTGTKDVGEDRESGIEVPYGEYHSVSMTGVPDSQRGKESINYKANPN
jgi:hypothetical protein